MLGHRRGNPETKAADVPRPQGHYHLPVHPQPDRGGQVSRGAQGRQRVHRQDHRPGHARQGRHPPRRRQHGFAQEPPVLPVGRERHGQGPGGRVPNAVPEGAAGFHEPHKDQPGINAAFFKIIANKYRNPPPPPPGVADDEKYQDDYLSKLNPIFQLAIAKDEYNLALSDAGLITKLEELKKRSRTTSTWPRPTSSWTWSSPTPAPRPRRCRRRRASSRASSRKFAARASRNASRPPAP